MGGGEVEWDGGSGMGMGVVMVYYIIRDDDNGTQEDTFMLVWRGEVSGRDKDVS